MQSEKRRMKRIMSGRQNPMPSSQKTAKSSMNNPAVFRTKKFIANKIQIQEKEEYNPQEHLY